MDNVMKSILNTVADSYDEYRPGAGDCVRKLVNEDKSSQPNVQGRKDSHLESLLRLIATSHIEDPGEWDLDDEQPVSLGLTLKEVRLARRLLRGEHQEAVGGLSEEVCALARYELEEAGLLESRKTNAAEGALVWELSADIQTFTRNWVEKRIAVEKGVNDRAE